MRQLYKQSPGKGAPTPWGPAQHVETILPGVARIDTAGHGGIWCDPTRWRELMKRFPGFQPWAEPHWLEEDCDWAYAALTWPEHFSDNEIHHAIATATRRGGTNEQVAAAFLLTMEGLALDRRARAYRESIADHWERGGGIYGSGLDNTQFTRVGDRAELIAVKFRPDDHKGLYTLEEIVAASERVERKEAALANHPS